MRHEMTAEEFNAWTADQQKVGKYLNRKTQLDGITFDSQAEAQRYADLKLMETQGLIVSLELQPKFELTVQGIRIGTYSGDFRYVDVATDQVVVEDVKSDRTKTPLYRWKKRHVKAQYGIQITEVDA